TKTPLSSPSSLSASAALPVVGRKSVESLPSIRSAFRFVTFFLELTVNGGTAVLDSNDAAGPPPGFDTSSAEDVAKFALSPLVAPAVFGCPRMKFPPVAAYAAAPATTSAEVTAPSTTPL